MYEVDVPEYAAKKKLSLETAAREMRYAVLNSAAKIPITSVLPTT